MPFQIGERVGDYQVIEVLGAGGMGQVYKARDVRLGRTVAVKITNKLQHGARFEREARAASTLNHPNICAIYDVGEMEGRRRIARPPASAGLDRALRIAHAMGYPER